jgi:LmbE family N-acetylglucosaminyl deacetylase
MSSREATRVLVIAAHPDDEVLGCGGTLALHTRRQDRVTVAIVCSGRPAASDGRLLAQNSYARSALAAIGVEDVRLLGFPDQLLDTLPLMDIVSALENVAREVRPQLVYCQHGGDVNLDHQIVFKAAAVATRPTEAYIDAVLAFDTASSTEWAYPRSFVPDTWVDISSTLAAKLDAFSCYESEVRDYPHPRSIEGLRHRAHAFGNQCCLDAAEVFMTVRRVRRNGETPL